MEIHQAEMIQQNQQNYVISGNVDFSTAPDLMQRATVLFKSHKNQAANETINIDLSQITKCNSAGLALMLEMAKTAVASNIKLNFDNIPETLLTIAKAYGVEDEIRELCK